MPLSIKNINRYRVFTGKGKYVGKAVDALFCPNELRVCGISVQPPRVLFVWDRKERYLAFDRAEFLEDNEIYVAEPKSAWGAQAAKRLGIDWDQTVVWLGMPARSVAGASLGKVRDALINQSTGELEAIGLTGGLAADAAVGVRDLPARLVKGFDGSAVVLREESKGVETSGGAAAAAGKGAAVAKKQATDAAATAASFGKAAVKVARQSDTGKKAMGWLKSIRDDIVDAMGEDEDD